MQNKKINTAALDFDDIKSNLKAFLQNQSEFQDYDFDGSALSVLLDVLAYNTHYNALYTNLAVNESFLDSASKRSSVVSRAKEIGYVPGSARCATARVNITVTQTATTPNSLILPKYSLFTSTIDGQTYKFYTLEDNFAVLSNNQYVFSNIEIKEGTPFSYSYTAAAGTRYIIPNMDVDLTTISVRVQDNASSSLFTTYVNNEEILNLTGSDPVYFIKEIEDELYELEFGNGVIGKAVDDGNIINIEYFVTSKSAANGSKTFIYNGASLLGGIVSVVTLSQATGGVDKEGIDTIRYNAPRAYSTQNRGVTTNDYKNIILSKYDEAESVNVWGGEDNIPPVYGKVFIAIKPKTTDVLTPTQKEYVINNIIKSRNVVSITPEIVDPQYIEIAVNTTIYYNPKITAKSAAQLETLVRQAIQDYNSQYLDSYDGIFRFSNFSSTIDKVDPALISNITTITLHRLVEPKYNTVAKYTIYLGNPIYNSGVPEQSIISNGIYVSSYAQVMYLEDLPVLGQNIGSIRMFYYDAFGTKTYIPNPVGSVNYSEGTIILDSLNITGIEESVFELRIKPQSNDVVSVRNQLVRIPDATTTVTAVIDKVATGDAGGNSNYIFTSSRN